MREEDKVAGQESVQPSADPKPGEGDSGVTYGYGHRAHNPDPDATYVFKPYVIRPLPHDPAKRWR